MRSLQYVHFGDTKNVLDIIVSVCFGYDSWKYVGCEFTLTTTVGQPDRPIDTRALQHQNFNLKVVSFYFEEFFLFGVFLP